MLQYSFWKELKPKHSSIEEKTKRLEVEIHGKKLKTVTCYKIVYRNKIAPNMINTTMLKFFIHK